MNVLWHEYWKFLDCFADLSTSDGLEKLEEYLKTNAKADRSKMENTKPAETPVFIESPSFISPRGSGSDDVFERSNGTPMCRAILTHEINVTPRSRNRNSNVKNFRSRLKLEQSPGGSEYLEIDKIDWGKERRDDQIKHDETGEKICSNERSSTSPDANDLSLNYGKRSLDVSKTCPETSLSELTSEIGMLNFGDAPNPGVETSFIDAVSKCSTIKDQNIHERKDTTRTTNSDEVSFFIEG